MAFKIALTAGHYKGNVNAIPTYIDPKGTTEWWLNSRIADKIEKLLKDYTLQEIRNNVNNSLFLHKVLIFNSL